MNFLISLLVDFIFIIINIISFSQQQQQQQNFNNIRNAESKKNESAGQIENLFLKKADI